MPLNRLHARAAVAAALTLLACHQLPARADAKIVFGLSLSNPKLDAEHGKLTPAEKEFGRTIAAASPNPFYPLAIGDPVVMTLYVRGGQERLDFGHFSCVLDGHSGQALSLDRSRRRFAVVPLSQLKQQMAGVGGPSPAGGGTRLVDTGQTRTILGHLAHHYYGVAEASGRRVLEIWIAPDLAPLTSAAVLAGLPGPSVTGLQTVPPGFALNSTFTQTWPRYGRVLMRARISALSSAKLPDAVFALPAGYTRDTSDDAAKQPGPPAPTADGRLLDALHRGDAEGARAALTEGAGTTALDPQGRTPLMLATNTSDPNDAAALPQPLSATEQEQMVALLLGKGAAPDARDKTGQTALMGASEGGDPEAVKLLLDHGADANAADVNGTTSLMLAARSCHLEAARLLLAKGAQVNAHDKDDVTPLLAFLRNAGVVTPGAEDMVRLLLAHGADVTACDSDGMGALDDAEYFRAKGVIALLKKAGAEDYDQKVKDQNK